MGGWLQSIFAIECLEIVSWGWRWMENVVELGHKEIFHAGGLALNHLSNPPKPIEITPNHATLKFVNLNFS